MRTSVIATAGHVDHGKSSLVRALTGMEPDRWEEERRRELTIDLGFAWTTIDGGRVAFVDVPGHRRFIGNMLAGLGPAPAVMFVVAADESWMPQSAEHLAAAAALGVRHVLVVVTRADLADPAPALARAVAELRAVGIEPVQALAASSRTGEGIADVRAAIGRLVASLPVPDPEARVRLWIDRAFTIRGAGTVVTGTLGSGRLRVGDRVDLGGRRVVVRGLQSLEQPMQEVLAPARVAVNLRGIATDAVHRGDALLTPESWRSTAVLDVRLTLPEEVTEAAELPEHLMLHVGTAAVEARVRPLGRDLARLTLTESLPLAQGDRAILREPGTGTVTGVLVLDIAPPALTRRGAGAWRGSDLATRSERLDLAAEVAARGHLTITEARRLGASDDDLVTLPAGISTRAGMLVADSTWAGWVERMRTVTDDFAREHPLDPWMPAEAARRAVGLPTLSLLDPLAADAGLTHARGRIHAPGLTAHLGAAEAGLAAIEARLVVDPFAAPEKPDLEAAGLGPRQIAAAVEAGRLIKLDDDVLLQPIAPAKAMRVLAGLTQPFTTSEARTALNTTRRVVIPLLEHLDARGWTRRIDAGHREIAR